MYNINENNRSLSNQRAFKHSFLKKVTILYTMRNRKEGITKTRLFKYIENFISQNLKNSDKKTQTVFIFLLKTKIFVGTR